MFQNENQQWQTELEQQLNRIVAGKFGSFAGEMERLQALLKEAGETVGRLTGLGGPQLSSDELSGVREQVTRAINEAVRQSAAQTESDVQARLENVRAETEARVRRELEAQISELRAQLESSQQAASEAAQAAVVPFTIAPQPMPGAIDAEALKAAIEDIDSQVRQADVLAALVRHAANFAPRVVFFVIKGGNAIGWKASGFANGLNDDTVRNLSLPAQNSPLLAEALGKQQAVELHADNRAANAVLLGQFGPLGERGAAFPLVIRGKAAAVLYADTDPQSDGHIAAAAIEALMRVTGLVIELLPVRRSAEQPRPSAAPEHPGPQPIRAVETPQEVSATREATVAVGAPHRSEERAVPVTPVPVTFVQPVQPEPPASVEVQMPATPAPELQPATVAPPPPVVTTPSPGPVTPVNAADASAEERAHMDARRFARLLVSEIKLYNEAKVAEGRRSHDLYERLKEDIDRSRQMYEKRVAPSVAAKFDYFYDELVHTLGEGDATKLGSGCPGPTVPIG